MISRNNCKSEAINIPHPPFYFASIVLKRWIKSEILLLACNIYYISVNMCQDTNSTEELSLCFLNFQLPAYIFWLLLAVPNVFCSILSFLVFFVSKSLKSETQVILMHELALEILGSFWNIALACFHLSNIWRQKPEVMLQHECYKWDHLLLNLFETPLFWLTIDKHWN